MLVWKGGTAAAAEKGGPTCPSFRYMDRLLLTNKGLYLNIVCFYPYPKMPDLVYHFPFMLIDDVQIALRGADIAMAEYRPYCLNIGSIHH